MKRILFLLLALSIPVLLLAAEPVREWKSKTGKPIIEAALDVAKDSDPETVYLLKGEKRYRIPFRNLSKEDQDYITELRESRRSFDEDFGLEEVPEEDVSKEDGKRGIEVVPAGKRYALLIGVNEYAKPIRSLRYCVNDMKLLAEQFEKIGIPKENIILVTDDSPADSRPTGANIRRQIENVTKLVDEGGLLVVAFSGHGVMTKDGKSNLCPSDTNLTSQDSVVPREWVFEQLNNCKAKQKIFIIDACREEFSFDSQRALGGMTALEDPVGADSHGFILIASCDKKQFSHEVSDLKHGAFTYYLVEGLSGAVKDDDGYVTIMNVFQYASSKTKRHVFEHFGAVQTPTFRLGSEMTDFCLTKVDVPDSESKFRSNKVNPLERIIKQEALARQRKIEQIQTSAAEFYTNKEYDKAIQKLEELLTIEPESEAVKTLLARCKELKKQQQIEQLMSSATEFHKNKDYDSAIQQLEEILKLDSKSKEAKTLLAQCKKLKIQKQIEPLMSSATEFYKNKDYDNAISKLEAILKLDYESQEAKTLLNQCRELKKQKQIKELQSSVAAFYAKKDYENAIQKLKEILKLDSNSKETQALLTRYQTEYEELNRQAITQVLSVPGLRAGERKTVKAYNVAFAFRWCPAGTFWMGSHESERDHEYNEKQHRVTLTKGFWIMETEVTQKQWEAVMKNNPSSHKDDNLPVSKVSWNDCQVFCEKTGLQLPTEAQWEYACRAGTTGAYAGNLNEMAWYEKNNEDDNEIYDRDLHPVGMKKPNAWGIYDMHGNAQEWCQDFYDYQYPTGSVIDPTGPSKGYHSSLSSSHVIRGGCYKSYYEKCRSASRESHLPTYSEHSYGFRCVLTLTPARK